MRSSNKAEDRLLFSGGADDDVRLIVWDYLDRVKVNEAMNFFNDYRGSIYNLNIIRFDDPKFKQKLPASTQLAEEELYAKSNYSPNFSSDLDFSCRNGLYKLILGKHSKSLHRLH